MADLRRWMPLAIAMALAFPAVSRGAEIKWTGTDTGGDGESWQDPLNWTDITADPAVVGVLPGTADHISLSGAAVHVTTEVSIRQFSTLKGSSGTIHIDDGGVFTGSQPYTVRYATINVNDGGLFNAGATWLSRTNITVNAGGEMVGLGGIGDGNDSRTLTVNGTFSPLATTASSLAFGVGSATKSDKFGKVVLGESAEINLDVFADGVNEYFNVGLSAQTVLELDTGAINLRPQDYVPQIGDSFDLWNTVAGSTAVLTLGDGSNIVMDGYVLDTSTFVSDGVVSVTGTPEPASMACIGIGGLMLLRRRDRRRQV